MKLTIGQKIGITLAAIVFIAGTSIGTAFGVKAAKEKNSGNSGSSVVVTPQPDNKTDDKKQDDQKQDDNKQDDQKQDEDKKTEQDYMNECDSKLKTAIESNVLEYMGRGSVKLNSYRLNELDGKIYTSVDYTYRNNTVTYFYTMNTNLNDLTKSTYEETSKSLDSIKLSNITQFSNIKNSVSEELYNQLCDYVLDKVGLEGAQILNATEFASTTGGMKGTTLTVYNNNKVYIIEASAHSGLGQQEDHINYMLSSSTNEIKIIGEENFKEFVTESTAQASAQSNSVIYFDVTIPTFDNETNKETTKTFTVRQTNGKADYRGFSC